jgi:2-keto-4-pentenoate hydratase/2-oxohepta-3-ene-1,7-dioic acid hydratase in catechol pathway
MDLPFLRSDGRTDAVRLAPSKIIGIGQNYRAHAAEMGKGIPTEPLMFLKPPSALLAPGQTIERPPATPRVDYEGELGVLIGRARATSTSPTRWGSSRATVRQRRHRPRSAGQGRAVDRAKGFDTFCPVGPGWSPASIRATCGSRRGSTASCARTRAPPT